MSSLECVKGVDEKLPYGVDWTSFLDTGDTITTSTWDVPPGLTGTNDSALAATTVIWLEGGTAYSKYFVTNHIETAGGIQAERTITVNVVPAKDRDT